MQEKEVSNGGSAPRVLSIDDYFMAEHDITIKDPDTGKTIMRTVSMLTHLCACSPFLFTQIAVVNAPFPPLVVWQSSLPLDIAVTFMLGAFHVTLTFTLTVL